MVKFNETLIALLVVAVLLLRWGTQPAMAQCCSPGNPVGGLAALGTNEEGSWQMMLNYRYGYSGTYFMGNQPVPAQFIRSGNYNHVGVIFSYGLTNKLTIDAETGYFINKTQSYVAGILPEKLSGHGLTDLNLQIRVQLWRNLLKDAEITSGAGIKIPVGRHDQMDQGARLTRDLQPTTGSYDFVHSLFLYRGFLSEKFRTFFSTRLEIKGLNPDRYRYGHLLSASGFFSWSPSLRWTLVSQLRGEWRGRDTRLLSGSGIPIDDLREIVIPTGSRKVFFVPQLTYSLTPDLYLSLLADIPLYQFYFDQQLATTTALTLSLQTKL
ncbi:MAG: hypothetical protein R3D00_12700 [Bacteroidia bacterium]